MAHRDSSSGSLGTLLAGALIGAAGLGWWLLSEAERRRNPLRPAGNQRTNRLSWPEDEALDTETSPRVVRESELQDKVQELNRAIEDVRRQLESMSPKG